MDQAALTEVIDATWPAAARHPVGPWTLREGRGGGSRVSAATADRPADGHIAEAEAAMRALGQVPLFMVRQDEAALDAALAGRGYAIKDPVTLYLLDTRSEGLSAPGQVFAHWPPLAAQTEIWAAGGIGPERLAIMARVSGPKASLLARLGQEAASTGFVAAAGDIAMLHALETAGAFRRRGVGRAVVRAAAGWAARQGARSLAILVTRANTPANSLYAGLGAREAGGYHYRILADPDRTPR